MGAVHVLNVGPGDCTIIQHGSRRVSVVDICCGNAERQQQGFSLLKELASEAVAGNFRMCDAKVQPLDYLARLGTDPIWRFILSHPDMDHMDGLAALLRERRVLHFWDSGVRRPAPDFSQQDRYREADWDAYQALINGGARSGGSTVRRIEVLAGSNFKYANQPKGEHDGLYILAPDIRLRDSANSTEDPNDGSYALLYWTSGGRIVLPGDAYDESWQHITNNHSNDVAGCAVLLAPHHGRDSDRSYEYLDVLKPTLTLIGCAPSRHIKYDEWKKRGLDFITSNQAGTVVLRSNGGRLNVFVENRRFAATLVDAETTTRDSLGHYLIGTVSDR